MAVEHKRRVNTFLYLALREALSSFPLAATLVGVFQSSA